MFESVLPIERPPLLPWVKVMLTVWTVTMPITLPFAALSGMAGDAGDHWFVYVVIWAAFTYPVSIVIAWIFRRKRPALVLLPFVNIVVWLLAGTLPF